MDKYLVCFDVTILGSKKFEKLVKVEKVEKKDVGAVPDKKKKKKKRTRKRKHVKKSKQKKVDPMKHQPEVEDSAGFVGRRPKVDPFEVGEETVLSLTYLNMSAGTMHFRVLPYATVNDRKSYNFQIEVVTSKLFSMFYKVKNLATTFVDYDFLLPSSHLVKVNESKQKKESRSFYDWDSNQAVFWEKKIVSTGEKSLKKENYSILSLNTMFR